MKNFHVNISRLAKWKILSKKKTLQDDYRKTIDKITTTTNSATHLSIANDKKMRKRKHERVL